MSEEIQSNAKSFKFLVFFPKLSDPLSYLVEELQVVITVHPKEKSNFVVIGFLTEEKIYTVRTESR